MGIKQDDEVIVPVLTFIATANAVKYCNAKPVFVDIDADYWCIDPAKIEKKITKKTKAIIPVHLYGHPCQMESILRVAKKYNLFVIEDAAESHGAEYKGKKVGSFGDISCFSFFGNEMITTGEGGMCLTDDENLYEKMMILKNHGMNPEKKYWHDLVGFNYRMTNLQAAVGVAQFKKIEKFIEKKRQIASWYAEELKELVQKELITLSPQMSWAKSVYWMYSILIEKEAKISRDELMEKLKIEGIETRPFFYPLSFMPPYKGDKEKFPVTEEISKRGINLPSSVNLKRKEIRKISHFLKKFLTF